MDYSVDDLLFLKATVPDLFYKTLTNLTNPELYELCHRDPKKPFCNNITFWRELWYARFNDVPPNGTVEELRKKYEKESLIQLITKDLYHKDPEMAHYLKKKIHGKEWLQDSRIGDPINREEFINRFFVPMTHDEIRYILTSTLKDHGFVQNQSYIFYTSDILDTALEFENFNLLYYYLLNSINTTDYIKRLFNEHASFVDDSLRELESILPQMDSIRESELIDLYVLCQPRLIKAFFESDIEDKVKKITNMLIQTNEKDLKKCPNSLSALIKGIKELGEKAFPIKRILSSFSGYSSLIHKVVNPEDIESLLMIASNDKVVKKLLRQWDVDRAGVLHDLMDKGNWNQFQYLLSLFKYEDEEYDVASQRDLLKLYKDFLAGREARLKNGIFIGSQRLNLLDDEHEIERMILALLQGKYLVKGLKFTLSTGNMSLSDLDLNEYPSLTEEEIEELITH